MRILNTARAGLFEMPTYILQRILWTILATVLLLSAGLVWWHISTVTHLQSELRTINEQRKQAQGWIKRYQQIQKQQESVNAVLEQDPGFKIKEYMNNLLKEQQLSGAQLTLGRPRDIQNGYNEISLDVSITGITMQQLANLMYAAEKNQRVYIKSVTIDQQKQAKKIDTTLTVATLHKKEA